MKLPTQRIWIELDQEALIHNIMQLHRAIHHAHLAPVIKCNAYGHGLIEIGRICDQRSEVYMLCVAFLSEALQLRQAGISKPILVLCYSDDTFEKAVNQNIAFVIDSYAELDALNAIGARNQYIFNVHIKIDTGLSRRGIQSQDVRDFIMAAQQLPFVHIQGICSHLARASTPNSPHTHAQIKQFSDSIKQITDMHIPLIHLGASSLISTPECSMVRVGLALYGYNGSQYALDLQPVLQMKSRIAALYNVPANTPIGYDGLSVTTRTTKLALIPVGYADGYDLRFSLCASVYVKGTYAPLLGRIGMNNMMIDVTDAPDISVGDELILIGNQEKITVSALISAAGMKNPREILARLNPGIPRYISSAAHIYKSPHTLYEMNNAGRIFISNYSIIG